LALGGAVRRGIFTRDFGSGEKDKILIPRHIS
jgi:hypothetical protein